MAKLTKTQIEALRSVAAHDGRLSAWCIGTRTANALHRRGLVRNCLGDNRQFQVGWRDNGSVWITDAGRAALTEQEPIDE